MVNFLHRAQVAFGLIFPFLRPWYSFCADKTFFYIIFPAQRSPQQSRINSRAAFEVKRANRAYTLVDAPITKQLREFQCDRHTHDPRARLKKAILSSGLCALLASKILASFLISSSGNKNVLRRNGPYVISAHGLSYQAVKKCTTRLYLSLKQLYEIPTSAWFLLFKLIRQVILSCFGQTCCIRSKGKTYCI